MKHAIFGRDTDLIASPYLLKTSNSTVGGQILKSDFPVHESIYTHDNSLTRVF